VGSALLLPGWSHAVDRLIMRDKGACTQYIHLTFLTLCLLHRPFCGISTAMACSSPGPCPSSPSCICFLVHFAEPVRGALCLLFSGVAALLGLVMSQRKKIKSICSSFGGEQLFAASFFCAILYAMNWIGFPNRLINIGS
jgi:hypothetical protein